MLGLNGLLVDGESRAGIRELVVWNGLFCEFNWCFDEGGEYMSTTSNTVHELHGV